MPDKPAGLTGSSNARWQALFDQAADRPLAVDKLAEYATAALFESGNTAAQKAFSESAAPNLFLLCSILDVHGVAVPADVAHRIERESRW